MIRQPRIDRAAVTFDEPNVVASAGLLLVATMTGRRGRERLITAALDLWVVSGARPDDKVLTLMGHALAAGGSHIDPAEILRSGPPRRSSVTG